MMEFIKPPPQLLPMVYQINTEAENGISQSLQPCSTSRLLGPGQSTGLLIKLRPKFHPFQQNTSSKN